MQQPFAGGYLWRYVDDYKENVPCFQKHYRDEAFAIVLLKKYQGKLSYNELSHVTGFTYEELQAMYDEHKLYRNEVLEDEICIYTT